MNKVRRKNLQAIIDRLEELKGSLEDLQAEEEEYRDNIPENMLQHDLHVRNFFGNVRSVGSCSKTFTQLFLQFAQFLDCNNSLNLTAVEGNCSTEDLPFVHHFHLPSR